MMPLRDLFISHKKPDVYVLTHDNCDIRHQTLQTVHTFLKLYNKWHAAVVNFVLVAPSIALEARFTVL